MRTSKVLTVIGIVAAAVAIAVFIGWFASREKSTGQPPDVAVGSGKAANKVGNTAPAVPAPDVAIEPVTNGAVSGETAQTNTGPAADDWEGKFEAVFDSDLDTDKMAEKMLEIYPHLKPEAQKDAIEHILNLVPDEGFTPVGKILLDPKTSEEISDDIMNDIGNRPGSIRMPLLLQVAKDPSHPKAAEARELLELYIEPEEELGNDWGKWEKEMKKYLEENPD